MRLATIVPTKYLDRAASGNYFMALAHLVGKDEVYTEFFKSKAMEDNAYVILDNGVIEGDQRGIEEIVRKANLIGASEIILPDVFLNSSATLDSTAAALEYVKFYAPELRVMGVPQGTTLQEWIECAEMMLTMDIDTIGIPKVLTSFAGRDARLTAITMLGNTCTRLLKYTDIHLLGCWDTPIELTMIQAAVNSGAIKEVRGCDSAIAYVYSAAGQIISNGPRPTGPVDFASTQEIGEILETNMRIWRASVDPREKGVASFL